MIKKEKIPEKIQIVLYQLKKSSKEAYLVGGCVRDLIMKRYPQDWDITTNATPPEILKIFPDGKYENRFGTVIVPSKYIKSTENKGENDNFEGNIEITTYRIESRYSDRRRPDEIKFAKTLEEDLSRRDFTCNALALKINFLPNKKDLKIKDYQIIDLFQGQKDIQKKLIRAVGDPNERFNEDALRMMRAIRFAAQLSTGQKIDFIQERHGIGQQNIKAHNPNLWKIEEKTFRAIKKNKDLLKHISAERLRDELIKIILSPRPAWGIELLVETGLMKYIIPEIYDTIGVRQNRHHYYGPYNTVYKHLLASLKTCPSSKLEVRLAAFLHDIGKPQAKRGRGYNSTFYGHEYIGARLTRKILERLKFPRSIIDKTVLLVKNHMFFYDVDKVGEHGVRRVIQKVGLENINDLIDVRIGDRLGSGVPKAVPYKLRHFQYMVEKVSQDPLSVKQLKINGNDLIKELKLKPGPIIGAILEVLLAEVIEKPQLNQRSTLLQRARQLQKEDLSSLRQMAQQKIKNKQKEKENTIKKKYWVK